MCRNIIIILFFFCSFLLNYSLNIKILNEHMLNLINIYILSTWLIIIISFIKKLFFSKESWQEKLSYIITQIINILNFMLNYKILMYYFKDLEYINYINYNSIYFLIIFIYMIAMWRKKLKKEKIIKNIIFLHYLSLPSILLLVFIILLIINKLLLLFKKDSGVFYKLIYKNILKIIKKFIYIKIKKNLKLLKN